MKTMAKTDPENAELLVHESVRNTFVDQAIAWNPLKTDNKDDILDLPTYIPQILMEHSGALMRVQELSQPNNLVGAVTAEEMELPF